jgi:hypothetical protein
MNFSLDDLKSHPSGSVIIQVIGYETYYTIMGNVPSSKNSRIFNVQRSMSFPSKTTSKYISITKWSWINKEIIRSFKVLCRERDKPYKIGIHFVRDSKRKYDWINAVQIIQDLMVKNGWIDDDNTSEVLPFPMELNGVYSSYVPNHGAVIFKLI